jgi:hypothetical protein
LRQLDAAHVAYIQMSDGIVRTGSGAVNDRRLIGRGEVKLDTMLAALPGGVPISVELPMNRPAGVSFASWAGAGMREAERILRSRPVGEVPKER